MYNSRTYRRLLGAAMVCWVLIAGTAVAAEPKPGMSSENPTMPDILEVGTFGTFVTPERLMLPDGTLDSSLMHYFFMESIESKLERGAYEDCQPQLHSGDLPEGHEDSLEKLAADLPRIFTATVSGLAVGFFRDEPGTLVRAEIDRTLKGETVARQTQFLFLKEARFEMGSHRICRRQAGAPKPPSVGDRILVFHDRELNTETELMTVPIYRLVILPSSGPVRMSESIRVSPESIPEKTLPGEANFLKLVEKLVSRAGERGQ